MTTAEGDENQKKGLEFYEKFDMKQAVTMFEDAISSSNSR